MSTARYAPVQPHDPITPLFDDVWLAHGSVRLGPCARLNRNMVIVRQDGGLSLINPVRLDDAELARLEGLGQVKRVIRLGDFHGMDDPFYVDRYQAEFWCQEGQASYIEPRPSRIFKRGTASPLRNSEFFLFESARYPEAALLLHDHKLLITTDSLQNHAEWTYTSPLARVAGRLIGFRKTLLIGPPWLKRVTPAGGSLRPDFERLLQLDFDHLIAAHGQLLRGGAKARVEACVQATFGSEASSAAAVRT
jgi:hypothetical protein